MDSADEADNHVIRGTTDRRLQPKRWYPSVRSFAKVPPKDESEFIAAFLGLRVHEALEFLYERVELGKASLKAEGLNAFRAVWQSVSRSVAIVS